MRVFIVIIFGLMFHIGNAQKLNIDKHVSDSTDKSVIVAVSWSTAIPMGEMTKYTRNTSGRGFHVEINQIINEKWTYGGAIAWQAFFEKSDIWYINSNSVISGVQRNYINAMFFLANTKYYFSTSVNSIKAYLTVDAGASVIENYEIFGLYEYRELEWHLSLNPGVGIDMPLNRSLGFQIYFKYANSFQTNSSVLYSWLNTGAGMYFRIPN